MKARFRGGWALWVTVWFLSTAAFQPSAGSEGEVPGSSERHEHVLPHPFLNHLGMPDEVRTLSLRASLYREGTRGEESVNDGSVHVEAGLVDRVGIHIRNDAVTRGVRTDVMVMAALLRDDEHESGVSVFGGAMVPSGTVPEGDDDVIGLVGVGARRVFEEFAALDANVHYFPQEEGFEYAVSGVLNVKGYFFPVVEVEGETNDDESPLAALAAIKFRLRPSLFFGFGSQFGVNEDREFDNRALVQLDAAW